VTLRLAEKEYAALCYYILARDHWKCRSCGSRSSLHVHHIVLRSQQGPDEKWNLITLCNSCHDGVHKDVKDGQYGLTLKITAAGADMPDGVWFIRRPGWRPL
jgi:5-methylcytosine-specific restriction endonuclease McrA